VELTQSIENSLPLPIKEFIKGLEAWGRENRIDYPWRNEKRVFLRSITELLLRRTTAEAVHRRWGSVLSLSDPRKVSSMNDSELRSTLRVFGLVSSRALEARELAKAHLSKPINRRSYKNLLTLRGIGPYTAAAILTFICRKRVVMSDNNYARVFGRVLGIDFRPSGVDLNGVLNKALPKSPSQFLRTNEAILDFAKLVCRPSYPKCGSCYANATCSYARSRLKTKS
jgi:A/G-specific adenine glycosylase